MQDNFLYGNSLHGVAIYDGAEQNYIGGPDAATGNAILYSGWSGVAIVKSIGNTVDNNKVGRDLEHALADRGNSYYGVAIIDAAQNTIGPANVIADNGLKTGLDGVWVDGLISQKNHITQNSIFANGGKGLRISPGANGPLQPPTITQANCQALLGSGTAFRTIEIFSDDGDEGRFYEAWTPSTPSLGKISWTGTFRGPHVTMKKPVQANARRSPVYDPRQPGDQPAPASQRQPACPRGKIARDADRCNGACHIGRWLVPVQTYTANLPHLARLNSTHSAMPLLFMRRMPPRARPYILGPG